MDDVCFFSVTYVTVLCWICGCYEFETTVECCYMQPEASSDVVILLK